MAVILLELTSMPRLDTRKPRSFPAGTSKVHLAGFNFSRYLLRLLKVCLRSSGVCYFRLFLLPHRRYRLVRFFLFGHAGISACTSDKLRLHFQAEWHYDIAI